MVTQKKTKKHRPCNWCKIEFQDTITKIIFRFFKKWTKKWKVILGQLEKCIYSVMFLLIPVLGKTKQNFGSSEHFIETLKANEYIHMAQEKKKMFNTYNHVLGNPSSG